MIRIAWLFLALVWGTTWAAVKVGLETLPPLTFSGMRFAIAGIILLGISGIRRRLWPVPKLWPLILGTAALAVGAPYGLQFWGQQHIASGLAAVLTATIPVIVIFMAHWALPNEPLTRRRLFGATCGFGGVVAIFSDQLHSEGVLALLGSVALLIGAFSSAWSQVWIKRHAQAVDPLTLAAWQMTLGSVPLLALGWTLEGGATARSHWTLESVLALTYLAIFGSAIAFLVLYWLLRRVAVTKVLTVAFANPMVAVALGWMWLGEVLSPWALLGGVAVLAGLWLILAVPVETNKPTSDFRVREGDLEGGTTLLPSS